MKAYSWGFSVQFFFRVCRAGSLNPSYSSQHTTSIHSVYAYAVAHPFIESRAHGEVHEFNS